MELFICESDSVEVVVYFGEFEQMSECEDLPSGKAEFTHLCEELKHNRQVSRICLKVNGKTLDKLEM